MDSPETRYLTGFPSLAAFIASDSDKTSAIFKRFDRIAARNLLHLQSELAELQARQDELDSRELWGSLHSKQYSRNWADFCAAAATDERQKERKAVSENIRTTLREYREALLLGSRLASLPSPTKRTLEAFRWEFSNGDPSSTNSYETLGGHSATIYDDAIDLIVLRAPEERDRLTSFVQDHLAFLFHTKRSRGQIAYASDHRIARFVSVLSTILAAILLVGAIVSLYVVKPPKTKLALIGVFTTLFASSVGLLTNARRAELFSSTAAYAAVLVVFVSGNIGSNGVA